MDILEILVFSPYFAAGAGIEVKFSRPAPEIFGLDCQHLSGGAIAKLEDRQTLDG